MAMKAVILSIGDEVLNGDIVDSNAAWLAERLSEMGVEVVCHETVGDCEEEAEEAIRRAAARAHIVVGTGGLGPTEDDLTRHAVARAADVPLELHEESVAHIEERFRRHGRTMPQRNRIQAMMPQGATVLANSQGTAPGFIVRCGAAHVAVMPGVPREMKAMFDDLLAPFIAALPIERRTVCVERLHLFGMPESLVNEKIRHLMARTANPLVGLRVSGGVISVKLAASAHTAAEASSLAQRGRDEAARILGDAVFGTGTDTLHSVVAALLERHGKTIAVAESCTGGLIGAFLTAVPGISSFFLEDCVTYSNEAKVGLLGVPREIIEKVGAVSEDVAAAMANGVRQRAGADIGLSTTGIAGPTGGSPDKPVGLVYVGLATAQDTAVSRLKFVGTREVIRDRAAKAALNIVRLHLQTIAPGDGWHPSA